MSHDVDWGGHIFRGRKNSRTKLGEKADWLPPAPNRSSLDLVSSSVIWSGSTPDSQTRSPTLMGIH